MTKDWRDENSLHGGFFSRRNNRSPGSGPRPNGASGSRESSSSPMQQMSTLVVPAVMGPYYGTKSKSIGGF